MLGVIGSQKRVWERKCDQRRLVLDQNSRTVFVLSLFDRNPEGAFGSKSPTRQGSIGDDHFFSYSGTEWPCFHAATCHASQEQTSPLGVRCLTRIRPVGLVENTRAPHRGQLCSCRRPATTPSKTRNLWLHLPRWVTRPVCTPLRHGHLQRGQTYS